jgi:transcriptional regulator GlxA family with amidase domain
MDRIAGTGGARAGLPQDKLKAVLGHIDESLGESLKVRDLAQRVGLSQFHFARMFRRSVGRPPHEYLTDLRMERAKQLLRETDLPLAQVATRVGYQTQAHFTGVFHREVGVTPRSYRLVPTETDGEVFQPEAGKA